MGGSPQRNPSLLKYSVMDGFGAARIWTPDTKESGVSVAPKVQHGSLMTRSSLFFVVGAIAIASVTVFACSDKTDSEFGNQPDATPDGNGPISPLVPEGSTEGGEGGGPVKCDPAIPASFQPVFTAPAKQAGACMADEIQGYWDACLKDPSKVDGCKAYADAHKSCARDCIEPENKSGPVQWHQNRLYYTLNTAGCLGLQGGGDNTCAEAYHAAVQCSRESCQGCFDTGGNFDQFSACQKQTQTLGVCKSYQNAQSEACQGIRDAGAATLGCFMDQAAGDTLETLYKRYAGYWCGP